MRFYLHELAYHELPEDVELPDGAIEVPRLPDAWEAWDAEAGDFVVQPDAIASYHAQIDVSAEQFRSLFITTGSGQAMTYLRKEIEARAWLADNSAQVPFIEAEATSRGQSIADVAQLVVDQADAWLIVGPRIEATRIAAKRAVSQASTIAEMKDSASVDWYSAIIGQGN